MPLWLLLSVFVGSPLQAETLYVDSLRDFERYAESVWRLAPEPAASGYFGDGASDGNGGIRGTCGIALAYATLLHADAADRPRRLARIRQTLRYAALTHVTGAYRCVDGKQWGGSWQSPLWAGSMGFAALLLEDVLPPDLIEACRRVVAYEADRLSAIPPADGFQGNSRAEENAWNSNILALAAAWLSEDPRAGNWSDAAKRYILNTYTVAADREGPMKDWVTTTTLYPSYACENHGFLHPSYQMVSGMSKGDSFIYASMANPAVAADLEPFVDFNLLPVWDCLEPLLLDSGDLAYPSGLDWALHGYGQVSYYAMLACRYGNGTAIWAEPRLARLIHERQALTGDGRFTGDSVANGFYREAVLARRIALAWWHHRLAARPGARPAAPEPVVKHLSDVRLLIQRSEHGFVSLSYGSRVMGLVVPESRTHPDEPYVVTPRMPGVLTGRSAELLGCSLTEGGFDAELRVSDGPFGERHVRFVSFGDAVVVIETPVGTQIPAPPNEAFPIGVENHELTGEGRWIHGPAGRLFAKAMSGDTLSLDGPAASGPAWACVSDRLGLIAGPAGRFAYRTAQGYNRNGAAEDTLEYLPDAPLATRYLIALPDADTAAVAKARLSLQVNEEAGGLTLRFVAPVTGEHVVRYACPADAASVIEAVPVANVEASSASERYPARLAIDGDLGTFWVSGDGDSRPGDGPAPEHPEWLRMTVDSDTPVGEIIVMPRDRYGPRNLSVWVNGGELFRGPMAGEGLRIRLPTPTPVRELEVRITGAFDPSHPEAPRNVQVAEVLLIAAP